MTSDARTPVIAGAAQVTQPPAPDRDLRDALEPVDLMAEAARRAEADAGARRSLLAQLDATFVPQPLSRRYPDPARLLNARLDVPDARTVRALVGGNSPQLLLNEAAAAIDRGELDVALIAGAEAMYSRFRAKAEGVELDWERSEVPACPNEIGDARPGTSEYEEAHSARIPIEIYPLFETALRARRMRGVAAHQQEIGALWERLAHVAAANPFAWTPRSYSIGEIVEPSPDNRVVTFPYTKRMCANLRVDQGAAIILTSVGAARRAGVPNDRLVFPLAGSDAHDHFHFTERWSLSESPALRVAATEAMHASGLGVDDVARFDLYSCFPSAVEIALDALGIAAVDPRGLTLTGGLAFFGGPGNNYVTHAIAESVAACRRDPGSVALVNGVGWYLTKHSVGVYSTTPPRDGFRRVDPAMAQAQVDALPRRQPAGAFDGEAVVEATAVLHDRDGTPVTGVASLLPDDSTRALAVTDEVEHATNMTVEAWEGRTVTVRPRGGRNELVE